MTPEAVELVVVLDGWLLGADYARFSTLGAVSEKARSTSLSLSADSINKTLSILSKGFGKGYLASKSTLELSSDPTAEGRLLSQDKGSVGINLPGIWTSFMLNREKFSIHLFTHGLTFSSAFCMFC